MVAGKVSALGYPCGERHQWLDWPYEPASHCQTSMPKQYPPCRNDYLFQSWQARYDLYWWRLYQSRAGRMARVVVKARRFASW